MLKIIINKILGLIVWIRYRHVQKDIRYFYRDTYYCQLLQLKYVVRDYVIKKPYKEITFAGEFGAELQFALPFAYWHYKNGTLKQTKSSKWSKEFYFFSPKHEEAFEIRTNEGNYNYEIPRILYSHDYDIRKWLPVPLKEKYKNNLFQFEKPTLIIANRYNSEWDGPPISFFSIEMLEFIINQLKHKYTLVYNRPRAKEITMDNSQVYDLNEYNWLKLKHPEVILMEDLYSKNLQSVNSFNHLQLMVYSNSERFLSIHGGTATFASYFEGTNLIYSRKGPEHHFMCYKRLYPKFSGAKILHARNEDDFRSLLLNNF